MCLIVFQLPRVRRTFRSLNAVQPIGANGLISPYSTRFLQPGSGFALATTPEYPIQYRQRTPRWPSFVNYQQIPLHLPNSNVVSSYRRFRSGVPTTSNMEVRSEFQADNTEQEQSNEQGGQLRFLGWLFGGRPSYSRYPDYSMLEHAAGIPYGSRYPSGGGGGGIYPYPPSSSSMVVEDCVESLDPYTHEMIEHCQEVPMYH